MRKLLTGLLVASLVLLPTHWFWLIARSPGYVNGLWVDYLAPKLYVSWLLVLTLSVVVAWSQKNEWQNILNKPAVRAAGRWLGFLFLGLMIVIWPTSHPVGGWWQLASLCIAGIFGANLYLMLKADKQRLWWQKWWTRGVMLSVGTQLSFALVQFWQQKSLGGYWLLGQPDLSQVVGLAKTAWWGVERILPYGATAHPNVLAGTVVLLSWSWFRWRRSWVIWVPALLICLITQSVSAALALVLAVLISLPQVKPHLTTKRLAMLAVAVLVVIPLLLSAFNLANPQLSHSWTRRAQLSQVAVEIFAQHPIWGVGLQQFVTHIGAEIPSGVGASFIQPAHHIPLLWLSETGLFGSCLLAIVVWQLCKLGTAKNRQALTATLLVMAPLAALDHYLLTLPEGQLLAAAIIASTLVWPTKESG